MKYTGAAEPRLELYNSNMYVIPLLLRIIPNIYLFKCLAFMNVL